MSNRHILLVGANGAVGRAALKGFESRGWAVTTLSRTRSAPGKGAHVSADLLKPQSLAAVADQLAEITHVFYAALKPSDDPGDEADENASMLENLVSALRDAGAPLERIVIIQGGKIYGAHLGVYKTPALEDDSRHFPPNLYFRHEDFVRSLEADGIKWTALRPDIMVGHSLGSAMNLGNLIGVYGALCRETGTAMQFPGGATAYRDVLVNVTSSDVLGDAAVWAIAEGMDGAFNITNGDVFRWCHIWPEIAAWFGLDTGEPQPISLDTRLGSMKATWTDLANRANLAEADIDTIAQGDFGDFIFHVEKDAIFDVTKARAAGFSGMCRRSSETLIAHLDDMVARKLIPDPN